MENEFQTLVHRVSLDAVIQHYLKELEHTDKTVDLVTREFYVDPIKNKLVVVDSVMKKK